MWTLPASVIWLPYLGSSRKQGPRSRRRRARGLPLGATGRGLGRLIPSRGDVGGQGNALGRGEGGLASPQSTLQMMLREFLWLP